MSCKSKVGIILLANLKECLCIKCQEKNKTLGMQNLLPQTAVNFEAKGKLWKNLKLFISRIFCEY